MLNFFKKDKIDISLSVSNSNNDIGKSSFYDNTIFFSTSIYHHRPIEDTIKTDNLYFEINISNINSVEQYSRNHRNMIKVSLYKPIIFYNYEIKYIDFMIFVECRNPDNIYAVTYCRNKIKLRDSNNIMKFIEVKIDEMKVNRKRLK